MINILSIYNIYINNKIYIDTLIEKYPLIKLILLNNVNEIFNELIKPHILYSNNVILYELDEDFVKKYNEMSLYKYNIYLFNYNNITLVGQTQYSFLKNYNINIIDYSINNKNILDKYSYNVYYLPVQINDINLNSDFIQKDNELRELSIDYDYDIINKIYDLCILSTILDEYLTEQSLSKINLLLIKNLERDFFSKEVLDFKIIYIDSYNNISSTYYELIIQICILNKVIVIINKNININVNPIFKKYVIELNDCIIEHFMYNIISNYNNIYSRIYNNFYEYDLDKIIETTKMASDYTINEIINRNRYGFIILRHVNSEYTNKYWIQCYNSIRKYYYNKIIIIDDNSNENYLDKSISNSLINCHIIKSEYPKRGEILGYYYLMKYNLFDKAVILHDSTFINKYIDFFKYDKVKFLWHFTHHWDSQDDEIKLLKLIKNNTELLKFYVLKNKWMGCFGLQTVIESSFLKNIVTSYNIFNIMNYIDSRPKRMNLERILGLIFVYENKDLINDPSIYGIIHHYIHWGYTYKKYIENPMETSHLDIIKVWTGR